MFDVDHAGVEDLFVDFEIVEEAEGGDDGVADGLVVHFAVFDFDDEVVGAFVVGDVVGVLPGAGGVEFGGGLHEFEGGGFGGWEREGEEFALGAVEAGVGGLVAEQEGEEHVLRFLEEGVAGGSAVLGGDARGAFRGGGFVEESGTDESVAAVGAIATDRLKEGLGIKVETADAGDAFGTAARGLLT